MLTRALRCLLPLALLAGSGCAETVRSQEHPALRERRGPIRTIAVAPFRVKVRYSAGGESASDVPDAAAALVARYVAEALRARGFTVIGPEDVNRTLFAGQADVPGDHQARRPGDPRPVAWLARERFGADALVMGELYRFRERQGSNLGATRPASVGFELTLHGAPDAKKLWSATFDETQQAMSENVTNIGRYPGGGSRWLTAEELVHWGATEVAKDMPVGG